MVTKITKEDMRFVETDPDTFLTITKPNTNKLVGNVADAAEMVDGWITGNDDPLLVEPVVSDNEEIVDGTFIGSVLNTPEHDQKTHGRGKGSGKGIPPELGSVVANVEEHGIKFETGKSVTFMSMHNTEKAPKQIGDRDPFQQKIEPAGRYVIHNPNVSDNIPNREFKRVTFKNPLVLKDTTDGPDESVFGSGSWKSHLSKSYGNKKGKKLSEAVVKDGFDGIVTVSSKHKETGEIVDLSRFLS